MRTLSRRTLLGVGLGAAASSFLAACAPPPAQTEATAAAKTGAAPAAPAAKPADAKPAAEAAKPAAPVAAGAKELMFHCRQGDLANHFTAYAEKWNTKNPTTPIKMETMVATNEYWIKLAALHASKTIGDNVVDISRFFPEMANKGVYREIQPFIDAEKFDLGQYYPAAVENGKFDGKLYALPETYQYQAVLIYYNKDMFDAAGVKYPDATNATFDELVEKADQADEAVRKHLRVRRRERRTPHHHPLVRRRRAGRGAQEVAAGRARSDQGCPMDPGSGLQAQGPPGA